MKTPPTNIEMDPEQYRILVTEETKLIKELNSLATRLQFIRARLREIEDQFFVQRILKNWSHSTELPEESETNDSRQPQIRKKKQD